MNTEDNKLIRKEEMLEAFISYSTHRGDARVLLKQRLEAILAAFNPERYRDVLKYFHSGILIDENCSEAKLKEIEYITGRTFQDDPSDPYRNSYKMRQDMFASLLVYRLQLESIHHIYDGIYECSHGYAYGIAHARSVNREIMQLLKEKIDGLIFLLLGDRYDKTFTVSELKSKYGYPHISDQELQQAILDDMIDKLSYLLRV